MMAAGSFQATRTTGTVSVCEIACSIGATSFISEVPCCRSTHSASKPWRAMTSAVNPCDTESQPSDTHFPSRHICLILFGRIGHSPALFIDLTNDYSLSNPSRASNQGPPAVSPPNRNQEHAQHRPPSSSPRHDSRESLPRIPRARRDGEMAAAERLCLHGPSPGSTSRRQPQDVLPGFHHRPEPFL